MNEISHTSPLKLDAANDAAIEKLRGRKVIIVLGWFAMGGAERQGILLARELQKRGVRVEVWAFFNGRGRAQCREWGIASRQLSWPLSRGRVRNAARLFGLGLRLRAARADFVVPYTTIASTIVCAGRRASGARACFWNQRDNSYEIRGNGSPLQRFAMRQASLILANSQHATQMMRDRFDLPVERVVAVKNGIEVAPIIEDRAAFRARWNIHAQALAVVMLANLNAFKDHATLLESWSIVLGKWRELEAEKPLPVLLLAGREDETALALRAQAEQLNLSDNLRFLGDVRDIAGLFGACDVAVHSSRGEGLPNAVLEAMACGLPFVGTDIPGIREVLGIETGCNDLSADEAALLAPIGDANELAARLLALLQNENLRARLGEQNRAHVAANWSPEAMCDQFCEIMARFA